MARTSRKATDPAVALAYLRVSTEDQNLGPEAQRAAIERWASGSDIRIVAFHEDHGVSGAAPLDKRPALLAALDEVKAQRAGALVVAKRDRLGRDPIACAMIERLAEREGVRVLSAAGEGNGDEPGDVLHRRIVDAFAEYERALIRARTRAALAVKRARGEFTGGEAPYGFRLDDAGVRLVPESREQEVLALVRSLRADGWTLRAIAAELGARGYAPRSGARWHPQTVANIASTEAA